MAETRELEISPEKTILMVFSRKKKREAIRMNLQENYIKEAEETKLLGIIINNKLDCNSHT